MSTTAELYRRAGHLGLKLEPRGDKLAVSPAKLCPPDFADELRRHKGDILHWLETRFAGLRPDERPWLHVARQVLAGEFEGADGSTLESLTIGLRSVRHPLPQRALARLISASQKHKRP